MLAITCKMIICMIIDVKEEMYAYIIGTYLG